MGKRGGVTVCVCVCVYFSFSHSVSQYSAVVSLPLFESFLPTGIVECEKLLKTFHMGNISGVRNFHNAAFHCLCLCLCEK